MGQGQDNIARSLLDLQPTAIIELFLLYFNSVDKENVFIAFHGGSIFEKSIKWQGIDYLPIPVESEGFEVNANGQMVRPKIRISNKDYFVTDLLINNNDLQFAKIIRKRTFVKYLDDENFDGGNPWGESDPLSEISNDTFVIGQKTSENKLFVEFELTSPLDLDSFDINNRLILSRYCSWYYRGNGCNYNGPPIETEDGRKINVEDPAEWHLATEWKTGISYKSGESSFIENKKIIIQDQQNPEISSYAKIWYVCQNDHLSSYQFQPDINENYWLRDGCNKKLDGCKKRFSDTSRGVYNLNNLVITNNYINFSGKAGQFAYNNIAPQANIEVSSELSNDYSKVNVTNMHSGTGAGYSWRSSGIDGSNPWVKLTWDSAKTINRFDLYDIPATEINLNNAFVSFYNEESLVKSGILYDISTSGERMTSGFANIDVTSITFSGSGSNGSGAGLSEICVFEPTGLSLEVTGFNADKIHQSDFFQLSTWIQTPEGVSETDLRYNVLHNISKNNQFSGINLYYQNDNLVLDYATVYGTGSPLIYTKVARRLSIPWKSNQKLNPIHIICSGGYTSGLTPTSFGEGFIQISGGLLDSQVSTYNLLPSGAAKNFSGEFFLFKNPNYQDGISDLKFGINDWQFSDSTFTPNVGLDNRIKSNIETTTNIIFGSTAIWTGSNFWQYRSDFFNRQDEQSELTRYSFDKITPRKYSEIVASAQLTTNLYAWWDMEMSTSSPYTVEASNDDSKTIDLRGVYSPELNYDETAVYYATDVNPKTASNSLPFGGFPGTERYGR